MELEFKESNNLYKDYKDLFKYMSCPKCEKSLDLNELLNVYGPEGLYSLARELIRIADEDMNSSFNNYKYE